MSDRYRAEEVAFMIGVTRKTLNLWYHWKKLHPDHEMAKLLPEPTRDGNRATRTRYWTKADVWAISEFKKLLPRGRNGILGDVTNLAVKTKKEKTKNDG